MVTPLYSKWTPEKIAKARALYEDGHTPAGISARLGGGETSIRYYARLYGWKKPPAKGSPDARRLAEKIKRYWKEQGHDVEIVLEGERIRSKTINGVPA